MANLRNSRSRGYILIALMLFFTLLAIAALAVLPDIAFQIRRDREEEMIHRALGYSRGIRRFYKKFGRYPTRIEDLENTNNLRFIRKRYQDPITGKDFKILRVGDPQLASFMVGQAPGQALQTQPGAQPGTGVGGRQLLNSNPLQAAGPTQPANPDPNAAGGDAGTGPATQTVSNAPGSTPAPTPNDTSSPTQQVFGGGPMLGVASTSKNKTIREFNNKNHYNDWLFIYDPNSDRGGLLNTPVQPGLGGGNAVQPVAGQTPNAGALPSGVTPIQNPPNQNQPNPGGQMPPEQ